MVMGLKLIDAQGLKLLFTNALQHDRSRALIRDRIATAQNFDSIVDRRTVDYNLGFARNDTFLATAN